MQVHDCERTKEDSNSRDVRAAGAEGFGPALSGTNAEDAENDEDVRANYGLLWEKDIKCTESKIYYLIDKSTRV
jgi:hypothetical protein